MNREDAGKFGDLLAMFEPIGKYSKRQRLCLCGGFVEHDVSLCFLSTIP
jgi:hypothetical protein